MGLVPEERFGFYRISESKNIHPSFAPEKSTLITFEFPCEMDHPDWNASDDELGRRCFEKVAEIYHLPSRYLGAEVFRAPRRLPDLPRRERIAPPRESITRARSRTCSSPADSACFATS